MSAATLVEISGLTVTFGGDEDAVLHGVALTVAKGERVAIVGQSGSGKSTLVGALLHLLPGAGRVVSGSIRFGEEDLAQVSEGRMRQLRGRRIGLVPQDPASNLNPAMRVGDQIADALRSGGLRGRAQVTRRVVELMAEAGIPEPARRVRQYPHEFSGGLRQRVLIAIALAGEPELLIADEPTSALDVTVQQQILDHLESLVKARGMAMVLITHDLGLAADRSDRIVVMCDGRIEETGTAQQIITNPQEEYTRRLIEAAPSLDVRPREQASSVPEATPILTVDSLSKEFRVRGTTGALTAVDDVSFELARGATTAIVGESGSGKTTLARMILGLERPTSGSSLVDGEDVATARGARLRRIRQLMQPVFQDPYGSLDPTYTLERLIDEPLRIFGIGDRISRRERVSELLDQVALPHHVAQRRAGELSGGQRQRVAIARALALNPALIICDEAVSALDVLVQDQVLTLLGDLQRELGLSYLFITHDLAVVSQIADQVIVMRKGSVVETGTTQQIFTAPTADYTRQLLVAIPGSRGHSAAAHRGTSER